MEGTAGRRYQGVIPKKETIQPIRSRVEGSTTNDKRDEREESKDIYEMEVRKESVAKQIPEEKYMRIKRKWVKSSEIGESDKEELVKGKGKFNSNHRGDVIISAKLREKFCSRNKEGNTVKIISEMRKDRINITKAIPKSFNTADLLFDNIYEANRCLERYSTMKEEERRVDLRIMTTNIRTKGVIRSWDLGMP